MNIYVGNIPYSLTEEALREAFGAHGVVGSVKIIMDRITGNPKGFAFVDMPNETEAKAAIAALNGKNLGGRDIRVNQAEDRREQSDRPRGGGRESYSSNSGPRGGGRSGGYNNNYNGGSRY